MDNLMFSIALNELKKHIHDNFKIHFDVKNNNLRADVEAGVLDMTVVIIDYIDDLLKKNLIKEEAIIDMINILIRTLDIKYPKFLEKIKKELI